MNDIPYIIMTCNISDAAEMSGLTEDEVYARAVTEDLGDGVINIWSKPGWEELGNE